MTIDNAAGFFAWDVSTFLALFLISAFITVLIDTLFFAPKAGDIDAQPAPKRSLFKWLYFLLFLRFNKGEKYLNRPKVVQWSAEFFPVLLLVFVLRGFVVEPFRIPSNSMMPTLLTGDFILVNKFDYGMRMPVTNTKLFDNNAIQRGDVVVFRYPNYERNDAYQGADFIKRVMGIPGDELIYLDDRLMLNGKAVSYESLGEYQGVESGAGMTGFKHEKELLEGRTHDILLDPKTHSRGVRAKVPEGHYLVMGDNRSRSSDSRFWGFVPEEYIIGRAFGIWMHYDESLKLGRLGGFE